MSIPTQQDAKEAKGGRVLSEPRWQDGTKDGRKDKHRHLHVAGWTGRVTVAGKETKMSRKGMLSAGFGT